jgi:hypothetical protein
MSVFLYVWLLNDKKEENSSQNVEQLSNHAVTTRLQSLLFRLITPDKVKIANIKKVYNLPIGIA